MKTQIVRIILLIGLGLGMSLSPILAQADGIRKRVAITVDGENVAELEVTKDDHSLEIHSLDYRADRNSVKGSGKLVSRSMAAPDFHAVSVSRGVNVIIGGTEQIEIEADDNLIDQVEATASKGTLTIKISDKIKSLSNTHVTVRIPYRDHLDAIRASSAASVQSSRALLADDIYIGISSSARVDVALKANRCSIDLSSAAKMKCVADLNSCTVNASSSSNLTASLKANKVEVDLSSAAKVTLSGSCSGLEADLSSAAKLKASELAVNGRAHVNASSGADAEVCCNGELIAHASSGADIEYSGDCAVEATKSSGGSVKRY